MGNVEEGLEHIYVRVGSQVQKLHGQHPMTVAGVVVPILKYGVFYQLLQNGESFFWATGHMKS
jgi:hypothetical protein